MLVFSPHKTFHWFPLKSSCSQDGSLVPRPFMYLFHMWGIPIDLTEWELHLWVPGMHPNKKTWFWAPEHLLTSGFRAEKCSYLVSVKQRGLTLSTALWFARHLRAVLLVAVEIRDNCRVLCQPCSALAGWHDKGFCNSRKHTRNSCK